MSSTPCHRRLLGLLAVACTTGCASMGAMQRADTLAPGRSQVLVETSIQGAVGKDLGDGERILWPYLAVFYRRGLSERVEWGAGASLLSLKTSLKVRLDAPLQEGVIVSVAPEMGGAIFGEGDSSSGFFAATRLSPQIGGVDGVLFQVGLGLLFGGRSEPQADGQRR